VLAVAAVAGSLLFVLRKQPDHVRVSGRPGGTITKESADTTAVE
jgi:hypothetical protein